MKEQTEGEPTAGPPGLQEEVERRIESLDLRQAFVRAGRRSVAVADPDGTVKRISVAQK